MNISPLVELSHVIPTLARWFYQEWHAFDGRSIAEIEAQLAENLNRDRIPITFVAHMNCDVMGTVSLDLSDLPPYDHFSPWLASLYVKPSARSTGIATALLRHAHHFVAKRSLRTMYLWTPGITRLYERFGWTILDRTKYRSRPITVMRFSEPEPDANGIVDAHFPYKRFTPS